MDPVTTNDQVPMKPGQNRLLDLFRQEKERFLAFAGRQLRGLSSLDPEDVVSEVFHALLDRGDLIGETENLAAYVYKSLGNRVLDVRRKEARAPIGDVDLERLADPGPDPLTAFDTLQVQERLTAEVAQCVWDHLQPLGVVVIVEAKHGCMTGRGVQTPDVSMVTTRVLGCFLDDPSTRKEVFALMGR